MEHLIGNLFCAASRGCRPILLIFCLWTGRVQADQEEAQKSNRDPKVENYLLNYVIDPTEAYVGQKVKASLQFLYGAPYQSVNVSMSQPVGMKHEGTMEVSTKKTITLHNKAYQVRRWDVELYPTQAGKLQTPAMQVAIVLAADNKTQTLGNMFFSMMGMSTTHNMVARSLTLTVKDLPESKKYPNVKAIGLFDDMTFTLQSRECKVGDGIIATMTVSGDGNLKIIPVPELQLPKGVRSYPGTSSMQHTEDGKESKTFEWTLQPDHSGKIHIPAQEFVYFDISYQSYKVLKSKSITINVEKNPLAGQTILHDPMRESPMKHIEQCDKIEYVIEAFGTASSRSKSSMQRLLSVLIAAGLMAIIVMFILLAMSTSMGLRLYQTRILRYLKYNILFYRYYRARQVLCLFKLLRQMVDNCHDLSVCFTRLKLSEDVARAWNDFEAQMLRIDFSGENNEAAVDHEMLEQAKKWFYILRRCCLLR